MEMLSSSLDRGVLRTKEKIRLETQMCESSVDDFQIQTWTRSSEEWVIKKGPKDLTWGISTLRLEGEQ